MRPRRRSAAIRQLEAQGIRLEDIAHVLSPTPLARDADDPRTRGVLAALTMRAHGLIAAAVLLAGEFLPHTDVLPPM